MYATHADMTRLYTEPVLIDLTNGTGAVDEAVLSGALAAADAEINTYLAGRYQLPLASVPVVLVDKACVVARYLLDGRNGDQTVRDRYRDAIAWLKDVAADRADLGLDANRARQVLAGGVSVSSGGRDFSRANRGLV